MADPSSIDFAKFISEHEVYYRVSPLSVVDETYKNGVEVAAKTFQPGFDVELYASGNDQPLRLSPGDTQTPQVMQALEEIAKSVAARADGSSRVEVVPADGRLYSSPRHHLRPEALVLIRITRSENIDEPFGVAEQKALDQIQQQLHLMGIRSAATPI